MSEELAVMIDRPVEKMIYTVRGIQVILGQDLAKLYGVDTKRLNEQVKRNLRRFLVSNAQARHNAQYAPIKIMSFNKAHDRFLIIDDKVYHIGASHKDLGKKWFAFSLMNDITLQHLTSKIYGESAVK